MEIKTSQPTLLHLLFGDTRVSLLWLSVRIYLSYQWIAAGVEKLYNPAWIGKNAGGAIRGFLMGALQKTSGAHPDVSSWYALFIQNIVLPHPILFSYLVTFGEIAVGIALLLGIFTSVAAFFGIFMNLNYLFAGTVSINPLMLLLEILLLCAWRNAGWFGIDYFFIKRTQKEVDTSNQKLNSTSP